MSGNKWSVLPEQASHGARLCIMLNRKTVVAVTPSNAEIDRYMADHIVSALDLQETYGGGPELDAGQIRECAPKAGNGFEPRELATILAALRFWQRTPSDYTEPENDIATNGGETDALSIEEIDVLCERLNVAG